MNVSKYKKAILAIIIANFIWGATPPILKWSLESISPLTLGFFRFALATFFILPFVYKQAAIEKKDWLIIFLISFISVPLHIGFFLIGLQFAPSINVPIIASAGPVFIMIISWLLFHEKLSIAKIAGIFVSLLGVLIIILRPILEHGFTGSIIGNILFLLSTITAVIHLFVLKRLVITYKASVLTFWSFLIGAFCFIPFVFVESQLPSYSFVLNPQSIVGILFGAIFASAIAWFLFAFAVKTLVPTEIGIFSYLDPVVTTIVAIPLLYEEITVSYLIGGFFVFLGIFIAERRIPYHPLQKLASGLKSIL